MKIEKDSSGGKTTIRLIGRFQSEHIEYLNKQLQGKPKALVTEVRLGFNEQKRELQEAVREQPKPLAMIRRPMWSAVFPW